jgi:hypothetical protein
MLSVVDKSYSNTVYKVKRTHGVLCVHLRDNIVSNVLLEGYHQDLSSWERKRLSQDFLLWIKHMNLEATPAVQRTIIEFLEYRA